MADTDSQQITVPNNSAPLQLVTGAQYVVTFLSGLAVAHHWFGQDIASQIAAAVPGAVALAYGVYRTWRSNKDKKTIINSPKTNVPDSVAVVK